MPRINPVNIENATGETADVLNAVKSKMGSVPNIVATMANSPAVANAYLSFSGALSKTSIPASLRERIAIAVGQTNDCGYCIAAHSFLGGKAGLNDEEILQSRQGTAGTAKEAAAVEFAVQLVEDRGHLSDQSVQKVRDAGYSDGEILEIVSVVSLNIFTNYFNHIADTEIDFPAVPELTTA